MFRKLLLLALVTVALVACGGDDGRPRTAAPATGDADATVTITGMSFSPETVEILAGGTVSWTWDDDTRHDVAFDDGPASPVQRAGTWQRTFDRAGTYHYVCTLHSGMTGTVVVR